MDFKLTIMKNYFLLLISIIMFSCSTKHSKFNYNTSKKPWIKAFKDKAFVSCLKESYNNDSIFMLIEKEDLLNPYDGFYTVNTSVNMADSLGREIAKFIPPTNNKDAEKKNYFMATCLKFYISKELDSISKIEYKKYLKNEL